MQMESLYYGGIKLYTHIRLLFIVVYLPACCIETVIKPTVKNKGGDLTDVNTSRAIALSNVEGKYWKLYCCAKNVFTISLIAPSLA
jgi:hypothetical protein